MSETRLAKAIGKATAQWQSEHGRCGMCDIGDKPDGKLVHWHEGRGYACGNAGACSLCNGCLPPGEICQACFRMNVRQFEC